jgi:hypothetical protein
MRRFPRAAAGIGAAALAVVVVGGAALAAGRPARSLIRFGDTAQDATRFLAYHQKYRLTATQQALKNRVLARIPAPCCKEYSIATCCCPCNLAKTVWGLAGYLIVEKDASAPELESAVQAWLEHVNPGGFSGDLCSTGGCGRGFADNGCGGMHESNLRVGR